MLLLIGLLAATLLYFALPPIVHGPPPTLRASGPALKHQAIDSDLYIDWQAGGPDFDPRGKCPEDFFSKGFVLLCKRVGNGKYVRFLYHKGRKLLYRIDKDNIGGKAKVGLHWVASTRAGARYRISDPAYKGGKAVQVPNAKGSMDTKTFHYGQAVSRRRSRHHRELFRETHLNPRQCPEWWDIVNFIP